MRRIYVSIDALQAPSDKPDPHLGTGISAYARPFITWLSQHGKVVVLTDGSLQHAVYLLSKINCTEKASVRGFEVCKTEILKEHGDVYLVDTILTPSEVSWFAEHGMADRVVTVKLHEGVSPSTKQALEAKFASERNTHK